MLLRMPSSSAPASVPPIEPEPPARLVPADDHRGDRVQLVSGAVVRAALVELSGVHDAGHRREQAGDGEDGDLDPRHRYTREPGRLLVAADRRRRAGRTRSSAAPRSRRPRSATNSTAGTGHHAVDGAVEDLERGAAPPAAVAVGDRDPEAAGPDPGEPRATWSPASVTMNDWMPRRAVAYPCSAPKSAPISSTTATAGRMPSPESTISVAVPTAERPRIAPTERSMPPSRTTNVIPTAMMPISDTARTTLPRLSGGEEEDLAVAARRDEDRQRRRPASSAKRLWTAKSRSTSSPRPAAWPAQPAGGGARDSPSPAAGGASATAGFGRCAQVRSSLVPSGGRAAHRRGEDRPRRCSRRWQRSATTRPSPQHDDPVADAEQLGQLRGGEQDRPCRRRRAGAAAGRSRPSRRCRRRGSARRAAAAGAR